MNEKEILLVIPNMELKTDANLYSEECFAIDGIVYGDCGLHKSNTYEEWLEHLKRMRYENAVPEGSVPSTTYFAVHRDSGKIAGMIDIRHRLSERLANRGGHIGYSIRPSFRGKGYAVSMLELALAKCKEIGMNEVLITCDGENIRSAKTAIHCGGKEEFTDKSRKENFRRFWIKIE